MGHPQRESPGNIYRLLHHQARCHRCRRPFRTRLLQQGRDYCCSHMSCPGYVVY